VLGLLGGEGYEPIKDSYLGTSVTGKVDSYVGTPLVGDVGVYPGMLLVTELGE
jgi:hypothetical protein